VDCILEVKIIKIIVVKFLKTQVDFQLVILEVQMQ
jgi:hypothetical protein